MALLSNLTFILISILLSFQVVSTISVGDGDIKDLYGGVPQGWFDLNGNAITSTIDCGVYGLDIGNLTAVKDYGTWIGPSSAVLELSLTFVDQANNLSFVLISINDNHVKTVLPDNSAVGSDICYGMDREVTYTHFIPFELASGLQMKLKIEPITARPLHGIVVSKILISKAYSDSSGVGSVLGTIFGVFLFVVLIGSLYYCARKKSKERKGKMRTQSKNNLYVASNLNETQNTNQSFETQPNINPVNIGPNMSQQANPQMYPQPNQQPSQLNQQPSQLNQQPSQLAYQQQPYQQAYQQGFQQMPYQPSYPQMNSGQLPGYPLQQQGGFYDPNQQQGMFGQQLYQANHFNSFS